MLRCLFAALLRPQPALMMIDLFSSCEAIAIAESGSRDGINMRRENTYEMELDATGEASHMRKAY